MYPNSCIHYLSHSLLHCFGMLLFVRTERCWRSRQDLHLQRGFNTIFILLGSNKNLELVSLDYFWWILIYFPDTFTFDILLGFLVLYIFWQHAPSFCRSFTLILILWSTILYWFGKLLFLRRAWRCQRSKYLHSTTFNKICACNVISFGAAALLFPLYVNVHCTVILRR